MLPPSTALAFVSFLVVIADARAEDADVSACDQSLKDGHDWDRQIAGCSRLLSRGARLNRTVRPNAYLNRGIAHYRKSEYDLAIADASEALRLKPALRGRILFARGIFPPEGRFRSCYRRRIRGDPTCAE